MIQSLFATVAHLFHPQRSNNHRPRFLHPEAITYLLFLVMGVGALLHSTFFLKPLGSVLGYASDISAVQVLAGTNAERAKEGLAPLQLNGVLAQAALAKGQDMFSNQYWAHTSPTGKEPWAFMQESGYVYSVAGENLARDFDTTPAMIQAWMNSPTHRANIVHPKYTEIGVAVINGNLDGVDTTLVVQMFGTPRSAVVQKQPLIPAVQAVTVQATEENDQETEVDPQVELATVVVPNAIEVANEKSQSDDGVPQMKAITQQRTVITRYFASPQIIMKSIFIAVVLILIMVLVYDHIIIGHKRTARLVGDNIAHIMLFTFVLIILLTLKTGAIL